MAFPFLFVLAAIFIILVKNVNSKLNNPDDSLGSDTVSSNPTEKDPDFPPVDLNRSLYLLKPQNLSLNRQNRRPHSPRSLMTGFTD